MKEKHAIIAWFIVNTLFVIALLVLVFNLSSNNKERSVDVNRIAIVHIDNYKFMLCDGKVLTSLKELSICVSK